MPYGDPEYTIETLWLEIKQNEERCVEELEPLEEDWTNNPVYLLDMQEESPL